MAEIRQKMRGSTIENDQWIGPEGQIVVDIERHDIRVHDGVTLGGYRIPIKTANDAFYLGIVAQAYDSARLNGQPAAFYRNADNLNAGILPAARFNDTTHGNRAGGSLHPAATGSVSGFMTGAQFTKLNGIEANADVTDKENIYSSLITGNVQTVMNGNDQIAFMKPSDTSMNRISWINFLTSISAGNIDAGTLDGLDATQFARRDAVNGPIDMQTTIPSFNSVAPYGTGVSTSDIAASTGFPAGSATLANFWHSSIRSFQLIANINATRLYTRSYHSTSGWSGFVEIFTSANVGAGSGINADTLRGWEPNLTSFGNTIVQRSPSGDISVRLVRSEYTGTNATIGAIMTQVDVGGTDNNYVRPSTPSQLAAALASFFPSLTTQVIAGNGMTGGGTIAANRTLTLGTPSTLTVNTTNAVTATSHTHAIDFDGALASFTAGSIGSYAMLQNNTASNISPGGTASGANLIYASAGLVTNSGTSPTGTWRCMGFAGNNGLTETDKRVSLFLRIS